MLHLFFLKRNDESMSTITQQVNGFVFLVLKGIRMLIMDWKYMIIIPHFS